MHSVALFLVSIAGIFLIGTLGEIIFRRTNIPDVLWLIFMGILIGPILQLVSRAQLLSMAPYFSALTLVFVLFEGGIHLDLVQVYRSAARSVALSVATFLVSTFGIMLICHVLVVLRWLPAEWNWRQELLTGAILGGTSPIVIMASLLRSGVDKEASNLLAIESALSDVLCIITVTTLIEVFTGREAFQAHTTWFVLLRSFGIGVAVGAVAGGLWWFLLDRLRQHEQAYPITLSALLLLYVLVESIGGSAALAVLAFALMVGNAEHLGRYINISARLELNNDLRGFHSQMVFIVKSFFFTFIGAMLGPPWGLVAVGVLLGAMLVLLRFPGAWLALAGSSMRAGLRRLVYIGVPRGVAAGVLATLPFYAGIPATADLPVIVFACVFATILIFSAGFPLVRYADEPAEPV